MIGIIGSEDSVAHIVTVVSSVGLGEQVIARSYTAPDEAPALASELDAVCDVVLFTGRVPYELARSQVALTATALYVRYSAVDLYRTLVILALNGGRLPRLSIDTIDREIVEETFHEVGVRPPQELYPLSEIDVLLPDLSHVLARFHRERYRRGDVEVCVTCMTSVRDQLQAEGIPVIRVRTTDDTVRETLVRAAMAAQLQRSEWAQVAVLGVAAPGEIEAEAIAAIEHDLAEVVSGHVVDGADGRAIVTTRGALERELRRAPLQRVWRSLEALPAWLSVGFGDSLPQAEQNSRYGRTVALVTRNHQEVFPDGSMRRIDDPAPAPLQTRNINSRLQALLESSALSPLTLSRLQAALAALGREDVTARELATEYGVEPRSARRLLAALHKAGLAAPLGAHAAPGAGRPQVVYKVDLRTLLELNAPAAEPAPVQAGAGE